VSTKVDMLAPKKRVHIGSAIPLAVNIILMQVFQLKLKFVVHKVCPFSLGAKFFHSLGVQVLVHGYVSIVQSTFIGLLRTSVPPFLGVIEYPFLIVFW
jgi:hypothetical protein